MLKAIDIAKFTKETDKSINMHVSLYHAMMYNMYKEEFNGEFSDGPKPSIENLVSALDELVLNYSKLDEPSKVFDENWYLIPAIGCMLIHRGSLLNPKYPLSKLTSKEQLLKLSEEFGGYDERYDIVIECVKAFVDVVKFGVTDEVNSEKPIVSNFARNLESSVTGINLSPLFIYAGLSFYAMSLSGGETVYIARSVASDEKPELDPLHGSLVDTNPLA